MTFEAHFPQSIIFTHKQNTFALKVKQQHNPAY